MHVRFDPIGAPLHNTFSLLSWNVHKEMGQARFNAMLRRLYARFHPDFLLLQEAVYDIAEPPHLDGYHFAFAINIERKTRDYGVLTASKYRIDSARALKTHRRELHVATRKSLLITTHTFTDATVLTLVNLHAINFVPASVFAEETLRLQRDLEHTEGPLVVAGDFNTWSAKRLTYLDGFAQSLGLRRTDLQASHHVTTRFAKPLDHVFYRGLHLVDAQAVDTAHVSDHNPIYATFKLIR